MPASVTAWLDPGQHLQNSDWGSGCSPSVAALCTEPLELDQLETTCPFKKPRQHTTPKPLTQGYGHASLDQDADELLQLCSHLARGLPLGPTYTPPPPRQVLQGEAPEWGDVMWG